MGIALLRWWRYLTRLAEKRQVKMMWQSRTIDKMGRGRPGMKWKEKKYKRKMDRYEIMRLYWLRRRINENN